MPQSSVIPLRTPGSPRINAGELVMITVLGQIASPLMASSPYRIGQDGVPRVLPGTGGIVLSHRVGDLASALPATTSSRAPRSATKGARSRASATAPIWLCRRSPASATPRGSCPARARDAPASSPASTAASIPCWSIFRSRRCGGSRSVIASKSMPTAPASSCSIIPRSRSRIARPGCWRAGACAATADGLPFRSPTWCPRPLMGSGLGTRRRRSR